MLSDLVETLVAFGAHLRRYLKRSKIIGDCMHGVRVYDAG